MTPVVATVDAIPFRIPLLKPATFSSGVLRAAEHVLVRLQMTDGTTGWAEACPRPMVYGETLASVQHAVEHLTGPAAIGLHPFGIAQYHHRLSHLVGNPAARSAVELALFDASAKLAGISAWRLLGGFEERVSVAWIVHLADPSDMGAEAEAAREEFGVGAFKIKVSGDFEADTARLAAVRSAVGDDASLVIDANGALTPLAAPAFIHAAEEQNVLWIEEPLAMSAGHARTRLQEQSRIPFLGDESCVDLATTAETIRSGACRMVSIKAARTAVATSEAIRGLCEAQGVPLIIASQGDSAIGAFANAALAAAHPSTSALPAELLFHRGLTDDLVLDRPQVDHGRVALPEAPGFGFEIDEEKVERYRL